jgi:CRISPR-associated protein Cas2
MMVLVCYDVETVKPSGQKRLTKISRTCKNYGQRVQKSLFECNVMPDQWELLKTRLLNIYKPEKDSLRFYFLGSNWKRRVEHHGVNSGYDPEGVLMV